MKSEDFKGILEGIDDAAALIGGQKKRANIVAVPDRSSRGYSGIKRRDKRIERSVKYGLIISDR